MYTEMAYWSLNFTFLNLNFTNLLLFQQKWIALLSSNFCFFCFMYFLLHSAGSKPLLYKACSNATPFMGRRWTQTLPSTHNHVSMYLCGILLWFILQPFLSRATAYKCVPWNSGWLKVLVLKWYFFLTSLSRENTFFSNFHKTACKLEAVLLKHDSSRS